MTDGPFKNTELTARWKSYGVLLDKNAFGAEDRRKQAQKALVEDLIPGTFRDVVREVQKLIPTLQSLLFPEMAIARVEKVFDRADASPQNEALREHLVGNIYARQDVGSALSSALEATLAAGLAQGNQRVIAHCFEVDAKRDRNGESVHLLKRHAEAMVGIDTGFLKDIIFKSQTKPLSTKSRLEVGVPLTI